MWLWKYEDGRQHTQLSEMGLRYHTYSWNGIINKWEAWKFNGYIRLRQKKRKKWRGVINNDESVKLWSKAAWVLLWWVWEN